MTTYPSKWFHCYHSVDDLGWNNHETDYDAFRFTAKAGAPVDATVTDHLNRDPIQFAIFDEEGDAIQSSSDQKGRSNCEMGVASRTIDRTSSELR